MLYCPRCGHEYEEGVASCLGCHNPLIADDSEPGDSPSAPGHPNRDPYFPIWRGNDEPLCLELCHVLEEAGVLHRALHAEDRLLHLPNQPSHEIGVPGSSYEKAEAVIKEAFGKIEETGEDAVVLLPSPFPRYELDPMLDRDFRRASVEIWAGEPSPQQEKIEDILWNNKVLTRWQWIKGRWYAFVFPEDESRARELIRDIRAPESPE